MPSTTYILGVSVAQLLSKYGENMSTFVSSYATDGVFPHEFTAGKLQLAIGASPTSIQGALSLGQYEGKTPAPMKIITTGPLWIQGLVTRADAKINTPADLKGKNWLGIRKGSALVNQMCEAILYAYNLNKDDVRILEYSTTTELLDGLKSGRAAAGSFPYTTGTPWVEELAVMDMLKLVSDTPEGLERILEAYPFFSKVVLPANSYRGQDEDVVTFGSYVTIDVHSDLTDDLVYKITSILYDNFEEWAKSHDQVSDFVLPQAIDPVRIILPVHDGAIKYYKENGYWTKEHEEKQQTLLEEYQKCR